MKKAYLLFALIFLSVTLFQSCRKVSGEGPVIMENRGVSGFDEVKTSLPADVYVRQGDYDVSIEAQQNIIDKIETVLRDDELELRVKGNVGFRTEERVKVYVTMPNPQGLKLSGSGNIYADALVTTGSIDMDISGSGSIEVASLTAGKLDAEISGSGNLRVSAGNVQDEELEIGGSGKMSLSDLRALNADAKISGSGDIWLYATNTLKVRIAGSGNVYYRGNPSIDVDITGSGSLKQQ